MLALFDESCNDADGHFSCKPFRGAALRAICRVANLANSLAIRLRLAPCISSRTAAPRPHGVLHQPASIVGIGERSHVHTVIRQLSAVVVTLACLAAGVDARAQDYPNKPIRISVPSAPG